METADLWGGPTSSFPLKHTSQNTKLITSEISGIKEYFLQNPNNNNRDLFKLGRTESF